MTPVLHPPHPCLPCTLFPGPLVYPSPSHPFSSLQSSLMDLADVFTAPAPPPASDPWGGPAPLATAIPTAAPTSDPWGGPPVPPAADPWGGPSPTPASGDPWRPAASAGPPVDPWGGTPAPAAGEGPTPDPWGSSDGECRSPHPGCSPGHAWGPEEEGSDKIAQRRAGRGDSGKGTVGRLGRGWMPTATGGMGLEQQGGQAGRSDEHR